MSKLVITLKNPPVEGDYWQIVIRDATGFTKYAYVFDIPMDEAATFDIPANWVFPLPFDLIVYQWIEEGISARGVYRIQSYWGADAPSYKDISIRLPGEWDFNFTTGKFEYVLEITLTHLELLYDNERADVPVKEAVPQGKGWLYMNVRNDIIYPEVIGVAWEVKGPDGVVIEKGKRLSLQAISPGQLLSGQFSDPFNLDKIGTYTVKVDMLMTRDELVIGSYEGSLCTVSAEIPPEEEVPPEEEKKLPWGTIALVGGGLALAIALVKPKA